ncbi:MAG: tRNA 2-thiouridine(34) synthase MnmA [Eubacteriales bacterium]|nr:tRNA 2-thiouridine(34) synthase MnmA [Eubacteriales bacterium]
MSTFPCDGGRVMVAMSGGVDSSVAAGLLQEQGYDCTGVTMKLFDSGDGAIPRERSCCSLEDVEDARSVAYRLGIGYHVFNFSESFQEEVIDRFIRAYENGMTPNPCIGCNRHLKFDRLYRRAAALGYDRIATGHYVRIERDADSGRYLLKKARDAGKDQSYVLYAMTQEQLAHTLFPLGGMTKAEVRAIAEERGFVNARKRDSQDICFVQGGCYADFIRERTGKTYPEGDFIDTAGHVLGRHRGIIHYTVGQRRGLGLSFPEPMYVCAVDPADNTVTLGTERELYTDTLTAEDVNLISCPALDAPRRLRVRIRYRQPEQWAVVTQTGADTLKIVFDRPQRAVTRGQAAVLYDGDTVVGGGTIR